MYALKLKATEQELAEQRQKLGEAEKAELEARKARRELENEKSRLALEVERRVQLEGMSIRESVRREAVETHQLHLAERDKLIEDMRKQIEELRLRGQQGGVQIKGEVLEVELEDKLRTAFPADNIRAIPNGRSGGDVMQEVIGPNGQRCGLILWESKNTRNWSNEWL